MNSNKTIFPDETYTGGVPINGKIISISFLFNKMLLSIDTTKNRNPIVQTGYPDDLNKIIEKFDAVLNKNMDEIIDGKDIILRDLKKLSELPFESLMVDEISLAQADIYFCTRLGFIKNDEFNGMIATIAFDSDQDIKDYILNKENGEEIWRNAVRSHNTPKN